MSIIYLQKRERKYIWHKNKQNRPKFYIYGIFDLFISYLVVFMTK